MKFLLYTFIITFLFWGLTGVLSAFDLYVHPSYTIGIVFYIIAACAPAISTYIIFQKDFNTKGIKYFLAFAFKPSKVWLSIILITLFCTIRFGIPMLFGSVTIVGSWWQVLIFTPVMFLFGGLEEIGWRGYLQPKLNKKFGFFVTTCIIAGIWILWHIPLCWIQGTHQYSNSYLWFAISLIGSAFSLAAIREITDNVLACIILHALGNALVSYGISVERGISTILATLIQIIVAMIIVLVFRKRNTHEK